ncbi:MAG TPA: hypothetical protein VK749_03325 [Xanthobacteraceae bacterium]|nr:hypothetical protein [Xanthobacteraceae bacterium]
MIFVHRTLAGMFATSDSCTMPLSVVGGWLWNLTAMLIAKLRAGRAVRHRHCRLGIDGEECAAMTAGTGRVL